MIEWAALSAAAAAATMAWGVRHPRSQMFAPSYHRGDASRPLVALTFDDGPSESTPALLDLLAKHNAPATFFACGVHARRRPAVVRALTAQGHELGNHTHTHPSLAFRSPAFMRGQLQQAQQALADAAGYQPLLFRPPYGIRWPGLGAVQRELGLTSVLWTVIGRDWILDAPAITRRVCASAVNGAIICLHDGRALTPHPDISATLAAVDAIIPKLRDRGYQFTTVHRLLCLS